MNGDEYEQGQPMPQQGWPNPIESDTQINEMILKAVGTTKTAFINVPSFKTVEVAVISTDEEGNQLKGENGEFLHEIQPVKVFDGWTNTQVPLPIGEFYDEDLIGADLDDEDRQLINEIHRVVSFLMVRILKEGKDYTGTINQLNWIAHSIANTSRSKNGGARLLSKTNMSKTEARAWNTQQMVNEERRKQGFLGRIFRRR